MSADRALRVALFSGNYNYLREGANQALNRLVGYLEQRGHRVRVYSPTTDTPAFEPTGTLVPVPSVTAPFRNEFQLALGLPGAIRRDLDNFSPELVHVSTPDLLDLRAQTYARKRGIPVVASLHTLFETYLDYYRLGWLRPLLEAHLRRFYRRADSALAPTPALVDHLKKVRGDDRVRHWSRGVDPALFHPERRDAAWRAAQGWSEDDLVVLFFGRPVIEKGIDVFMEAVRRLQRERHNVRPLVVGEGPGADRLRTLDGAVLTGHLQGEALARAVAGADVMINPSVTEAFGTVIIEAMASGLPVISADAPNARAILDPGTTGFLVEAANPAAYADAVAHLADAPGERRRIGAAAHAASAAYSWDAASGAVEAAYFEIVADYRRRAAGSIR